MRFCECFNKNGIAVGGSIAQSVMYMGNTQPFKAQSIFITNKIMRQTNRI